MMSLIIKLRDMLLKLNMFEDINNPTIDENKIHV
jgi:hypothetical protein